MIYLEQWWGFYRACTATRFATLKGKLYKASVRSRTNILLLASSPTTIRPSFLIWNKCCRFPGQRLPIVCLERLMMTWKSDTGVPLGGKCECNNWLYSESMGTSCKTPERREGWTSCFLHDNAWDFFSVWKKKSSSTWAPETHFWCNSNQQMGLQMFVAATEIRKALKSSKAFQTCWAWSLLFRLLYLSLLLRLPSPSVWGWCFQSVGSAALWPGEGHVLYQQPTAWAPCDHAAQAQQ